MPNTFKLSTSLLILLAGCGVESNWVPIEPNRTGYPDAWYYERLTPYYGNTLYLTPSVSLRAVRGLVGVAATLEDGTEGHFDVWRSDIELFFSAPVEDSEARIALAQSAVLITCPQTEIVNLADNVAFANAIYMVLQNVPCLGHAS